ncbi:CENPX protein, partial [Glareola pratincola]|nr:CENPX protein [Glareola pratincola]
ETVDRLLRLHFRDGRTRVNGDAQLLMAEMLKVFVRGECAAPIARPDGPRASPTRPGGGPVPAGGETPRAPGRRLQRAGAGGRRPPAAAPHRSPHAEAAARAARQAQAEDLEKVDVEHVEKVLPQLVGNG